MAGIAALLLELGWALVPPLLLLLCFVTQPLQPGGLSGDTQTFPFPPGL